MSEDTATASSRALPYFQLFSVSSVSTILCAKCRITDSLYVPVFTDILSVPINETDVFCQVLFGGFDYH